MTLVPLQALALIPTGLRDPLIEEFRSIIQSFLERRWMPTELGGGRFCEIVFTILDGHAKGTFANVPSKPQNFVQACRQLENNSHVPRSFQILIPRVLPALYEIRNNRGVGHVGGDVDPNFMDATAVVGMVNWIMAELVRVFHQSTIVDAQNLVDALVERKIPIVWAVDGKKRVLDTNAKLSDQILLLVHSNPTPVATEDLLSWSGYANRGYFFRTVRELHSNRFVELSTDESAVQILPPGTKYVETLISKKYLT